MASINILKDIQIKQAKPKEKEYLNDLGAAQNFNQIVIKYGNLDIHIMEVVEKLHLKAILL